MQKVIPRILKKHVLKNKFTKVYTNQDLFIKHNQQSHPLNHLNVYIGRNLLSFTLSIIVQEKVCDPQNQELLCLPFFECKEYYTGSEQECNLIGFIAGVTSKALSDYEDREK